MLMIKTIDYIVASGRAFMDYGLDHLLDGIPLDSEF